MTGTIGYGSLLAALVLAVWGGAAPLLGARTGRAGFFASARAAIAGQFALVTVASLALIYALVTTDFSIKYVALNTTRATPIYYRVTGLWGALEGSLLLWEWILIIFSGVVAWTYRDRPVPPSEARISEWGHMGHHVRGRLRFPVSLDAVRGRALRVTVRGLGGVERRVLEWRIPER